jgi:hypothetical protein
MSVLVMRTGALALPSSLLKGGKVPIGKFSADSV